MSRFILFAFVAGLAVGEPLDAILVHMDAAAKTSNSFTAELVWRKFTKSINDTDEQTGSLKLRRSGNRIVGRLDVVKPNSFTWHFMGDTWEKYLPKAQELQVYKVDKYSKAVDLMLTSAFGLTSASVKKNYEATAGSEETVNGIKATRLELVPKDKKAKEYVAKIELWIPIGQTYAVQQKEIEPNGDFNLLIYNDAKLNPPLPASAFDFVAPPGVKQHVMN